MDTNAVGKGTETTDLLERVTQKYRSEGREGELFGVMFLKEYLILFESKLNRNQIDEVFSGSILEGPKTKPISHLVCKFADYVLDSSESAISEKTGLAGEDLEIHVMNNVRSYLPPDHALALESEFQNMVVALESQYPRSSAKSKFMAFLKSLLPVMEGLRKFTVEVSEGVEKEKNRGWRLQFHADFIQGKEALGFDCPKCDSGNLIYENVVTQYKDLAPVRAQCSSCAQRVKLVIYSGSYDRDEPHGYETWRRKVEKVVPIDH